MDIVIRSLGIVFIFIAIIYLLKPNVLRGIMEFFKRGKRMYFAGLIRFVLAIIFLLGARECDVTWVIVVFGILFIVSGLLIFVMGLERLKSMLDWYLRQPIMILRVIAAIGLAVGAIIVYCA